MDHQKIDNIFNDLKNRYMKVDEKMKADYKTAKNQHIMSYIDSMEMQYIFLKNKNYAENEHINYLYLYQMIIEILENNEFLNIGLIHHSIIGVNGGAKWYKIIGSNIDRLNRFPNYEYEYTIEDICEDTIKKVKNINQYIPEKSVFSLVCIEKPNEQVFELAKEYNFNVETFNNLIKTPQAKKYNLSCGALIGIASVITQKRYYNTPELKANSFKHFSKLQKKTPEEYEKIITDIFAKADIFDKYEVIMSKKEYDHFMKIHDVICGKYEKIVCEEILKKIKLVDSYSNNIRSDSISTGLYYNYITLHSYNIYNYSEYKSEFFEPLMFLEKYL